MMKATLAFAFFLHLLVKVVDGASDFCSENEAISGNFDECAIRKIKATKLRIVYRHGKGNVTSSYVIRS